MKLLLYLTRSLAWLQSWHAPKSHPATHLPQFDTAGGCRGKEHKETANDVYSPRLINAAIWDKGPQRLNLQRKALICSWKTQLCLHLWREISILSDLQHIGSWANWRWQGETDRIREQKINRGGGLVGRGGGGSHTGTNDCSAISRQLCMCVVHTWVHKAGRRFPSCSTFTLFPVVPRLGFSSTQAVLNNDLTAYIHFPSGQSRQRRLVHNSAAHF